MSYFERNYPALAYPVPQGDVPGFRDAQRGALFALGSHFSLRRDPAIVTMPTGSGKTAVLQASSFLLRAKRVLVMTPSRLVREQIYDDYQELGVLKRLGALPPDLEPPQVFNANAKIGDWESLRGYDVVVATPNSASPGLEGVAPPPPDFFDLMLVDEAHHSPARTWTDLLRSFPGAKRALFTATPYRRDELEIKGRFVFTYDLKRAFEDGVFGQIQYLPVEDFGPGEEDAAIARAAEAKLRADHAAGLAHRLMVRTDSKNRARDLLDIYGRTTGLKLQLVLSEHSVGHVKKVITALRSGELDGIVCVNMLGEGFDLPNLKVAAIHTPHKSLAVTLQFIGRFARTAGENLGQATFIAAPSSIKVEAEKLYAQGAAWHEIVPNLSATRVMREERAREILESFSTDPYNPPDLEELSLYGLKPYMHVKVWQLAGNVRIDESIEFPEGLTVVYTAVSEDFNTALFIAREHSRVSWADDDRLTDVENHLFIIHHNRQNGFLFVCTSKRQDGTYSSLAKAIAGRPLKGLSTSVLDRVLLDLDNPKFFNIGMRNRSSNSPAEQYTIKAGGSVDRTINRATGRQYIRGHFFGSGIENGEEITIGASSASKIWKNSSARVHDLIEWMDALAAKLATTRPVVTNSGLDHLATAQEIQQLPCKIFCADWDKDVYLHPWLVTVPGPTGPLQVQLTNFSLLVDHDACTDHQLPILVHGPNASVGLIYDVRGNPFFRLAGTGPDLTLERRNATMNLVDYLNERPLHFLTVNLGTVRGSDYVAPSDPGEASFEPSCMDLHDFVSANVCINTEVGTAPGGKLSIFEYVEAHLLRDPHTVIFCDHGSGEIADYIALRDTGDGVDIEIFHCKSTKAAAPGARVADAYEVIGQAIKSARWCQRDRIRSRIEHRMNGGGGNRFVQGTFAEVERLLGMPKPPAFHVVAVQPGFKGDGLSGELKQLFASAHLHLRHSDVTGFRIMASP